uniref:Fibroblast growth factor 17 n=1 Tax=Romanomermis culicivorax TaxID=13658 RepID=A0A915JYS7_ROMCU
MLFGCLENGSWSLVRPEAILKRRFEELGSAFNRCNILFILIMVFRFTHHCSAIPSSSSSLENEELSSFRTLKPFPFENTLKENIKCGDYVSTSTKTAPTISITAAEVSTTENVDNKYSNLDYFSLAKVVRNYKLHNRCSGKYLQIYLKEVNARGKQDSPLVGLRVETDTYGSRIRIQSEKFNKYLCLSRQNRTTTKYNGRNLRCVFIEHISDNHYTELESAAIPGLYLGFNRHGRFVNPKRYRKKRTCFQYIKTERMSSHLEAFHRRTVAAPLVQQNMASSVNRRQHIFRMGHEKNRTLRHHQHKNHWRRRHRRHRRQHEKELNLKNLSPIS